jgi:hypothetical protein
MATTASPPQIGCERMAGLALEIPTSHVQGYGEN